LKPNEEANARRAAAVLVAEILVRGRTLDEAMEDTTSFRRLEGRDRGFARAIASATLRRLGTIDAALERFLAKPLPESAQLARAILRTGAAQLLVLGVGSHAAVSESVSLARQAQSTAPFAKLINAVLRRIAEQREALATTDPGLDLPDWLFARWRAAYGDEQAVAIAEALRTEPPLDIIVKADPDLWAERLGGRVFEDDTIRLAEGGDVASLPGFAEGAWWVQDAAAAKPVRMLGDVTGLTALDLCAAPGGKTMQLAARGASVTALDASAARLERVRENLARTQLTAEIVHADALAWSSERLFDIVLLDAPCTATGTVRRHPEAAWLRKPDDVRTMADLQTRLFDRAIGWTKPNGVCLYAVCSLEPEEGEEIIAAGLRHHGDSIALMGPALRTTPATRAAEGGMDGFFAQMVRRAP
jgi:16S rRNA (cytosine967-C5)-methyltransferase